MYLIPRLIGVGTYFITLIIFTYFLKHTTTKDRKLLLMLYSIMLFIIGYNFIPPSGGDLYRLIPIMKIYSSLSLTELLSIIKGSTMPVTVIYYYIIGQFDNDGLLAGITVFIVYAILFYVYYKSSIKYNLLSSKFGLLIFWLMSSSVYGATIDNIRTTLALAIITLAIYREFVNDKSILSDIPLYIIASFIHVMGVVVTIIRIGYLCFEKTNNIRSKLLRIVLFIIICVLGYHFGQKSIESMGDKAEKYFTSDGYFYIWNVIVAFAGILICLYIFYILKTNKHIIRISYMNYNGIKLIGLIILISVAGLFFDYSTFHRLNLFVAMCMPFLSIPILTVKNTELDKKVNYAYLYIVISVMLIVNCARGSLCSLKFFI